MQLSSGTENYAQPKSSLLGIPLCDGMHGPRAIIQVFMNYVFLQKVQKLLVLELIFTCLHPLIDLPNSTQ